MIYIKSSIQVWKLIKLGITYFDIVIDFKQKSKLKLHCSMSKYQ